MEASADLDDRARALALLKRHGWNATSFQILEAGFQYWFDGDDACVAYMDTGGAWVAAGAPVADPARFEALAAGFVAAAAEAGRRVCFFASETRFAHAVSLASVSIGEQPVWDPTEWDVSLRASRSLREQLRRARAKGVVIRQIAPAELLPSSPVRAQIEHVIERWLGTRAMAPMGFLVKVAPFTFPDERRGFVAEKDGKVIGFLSAIPVFGRQGWFLEHILRAPDAPNGTSELLVDAALRAAAADGSRYATLGLAPLAGNVGGILRLARRISSALYDFNGIHAFKAKLRPKSWEPIFLTYPARVGVVRAMIDSLAAFSRGGLFRFGLETLLRGPAIVVRVLALLLIPWTIVLALPAATRWFPSSAVQIAWVLFDIVVGASLFVLTVRWRRWLATLLAWLVTLDAALTTVEALVFNASRLHGVGEIVIVLAAVLAPTSAAIILWSARAHRARW